MPGENREIAISAQKAARAIRQETARDEERKQTVYEASIPFDAIGIDESVLGRAIQFNLLVNDNDGEMRESYLRLTPGLGSERNPAAWYRLSLRPREITSRATGGTGQNKSRFPAFPPDSSTVKPAKGQKPKGESFRRVPRTTLFSSLRMNRSARLFHNLRMNPYTSHFRCLRMNRSANLFRSSHR